MPRTNAVRLSCLMLGGLAFAANHCQAQSTTASPDLSKLSEQMEQQRLEVSELQRLLAEQERTSKAYRERLESAQRRIEALQRSLNVKVPSDSPGSRTSPETLGQIAGRGGASTEPIAQAQQPAAPPPAQQPANQPAPTQGGQTVGQAPQRTDTKPPEVAPIFQQPGVLTPKGKWVLEPSLQYAYSSSTRVSAIGFEIFPALLIGVLDIRNANRTNYTAQFTARRGFTNRFEMEAKLPWVYSRETLQTREFLNASFNDQQFQTSGSGLGDVELTGRYQFNEGGMEKPYFVGSLRFKSRTGKDPFEVERDPELPRGGGRLKEQPTGTGFYGLQPGITVLYPTDPAVFFGSLTYLWNVKRKNVSDTLGRSFENVDPGDAVGFNFGMGLALNEKASFSLGYDHSIFGKTKVNGSVQEGQLTAQLGTFLLGYSYRLSPKTNVNLSLGIGVTSDAPDLQLNFRVPVSF